MRASSAYQTLQEQARGSDVLQCAGAEAGGLENPHDFVHDLGYVRKCVPGDGAVRP